MKKILLLIMVLVLSLSTVACGKAGENDGAKDKADEKKVVAVKDGKPSKEILDASKFDPEIQIGKSVLQIPFTFQDVLDAGATIQGNEYTPEYMMMADDVVSVKFSIGDGQMRICFKNDSDTVCSLKDATVYASMGYGIESDSSSVILAGGIRTGSTLSELQDAWGTADAEQAYDSSFMYRYLQYPDIPSASGDYYNLRLDRNTGKVTTVQMNYTPKLDQVVETLVDRRESLEESFDVLMPMPYYAVNVTIGDGYTVESIDGVDYVIRYPRYGLGQEVSRECDYSPTEEALNSVLTASKYFSITEPIEQTCILKNEEQVGVICAFYTSSETGRYTCRVYLVGREVEHCVYFETSIYAGNGEAISDSAKTYFVELMKELMSGCRYVKIK